MNIDTIRLHYTYLIALIVLLGAGYLLLTPTPDITGGEKLAFVGAAVGVVLAFIFNRESAVSAARATERAIEQGVTGEREVTRQRRESVLRDQAEPGVLRDQQHP